MSLIRLILGLSLAIISGPALAQTGIPLITATQSTGGTEYSLTLQLLLLMTMLTLLPSMVLMMTSFTRIIIVLSLLRQALGTAQTPPNQILLGIALFLTIFIMMPVFTEVYNTGLGPYFDGNIDLETAIANMQAPIRTFMLNQTRQEDIAMFAEIARAGSFATPDDIPFTILVPSFVTSELKSAFTIGFLIYIPFVVIDLVVASVLMSMGMMMLSPMMISMPFKLMLFVLVDGWTLIMGSLASSFMV